VGEIVAEYGLLRACVQELAESRGLSFCGDAARIIGSRIDKAIRRAVETFVSHQSEETRRRREEHLAFVLHDLKTPLSAVDMASRLLESDLADEAKSGRSRMLFEALRRNVGRLGALVKATVYADAPALSQVFQNLLSNAIRYAPGGTVTAGARSLEGGGVEESRLSKVFEKGETDGRAGGTGLGLAIVRQVVEAHGGRVRAESRTGEGTTFVFDIPGEPPADNAAPVTDRTRT
jgi:signal transduction histidine kinase